MTARPRAPEPVATASRRGKLREVFRRWARQTGELVGSPGAFIGAGLVIVIWAATGPLFRYSDTWQLVINTTSSIITFLMVFVIQTSQNRDTRSIQLKLDELIKSMRDARNSVIDLERLTDEQLRELEEDYKRLCLPDRREV